MTQEGVLVENGEYLPYVAVVSVTSGVQVVFVLALVDTACSVVSDTNGGCEYVGDVDMFTAVCVQGCCTG